MWINLRGGNTAGEFLRIYRIRLVHSSEHGIVAHGSVELIEYLARQSSDAFIEGQPFLGPESSSPPFGMRLEI
jgi:hypothetical protein